MNQLIIWVGEFMNRKNVAVKAVAVIMLLVMMFSVAPVNVLAAGESQASGHALVITSDSLTVSRWRTVQMTASVTNVDTQPEITWTSSDTSVATVDENGVVRGVDVGRSVIKATATVDGKTISGEFEINVTTQKSLIKNLLEKYQILSYQYSYIDDYYYTNDKEAWQYNFGFGKIYDFLAPYILLEYDYVRVFFTYEDKDWMIQMWKGQYGMIFFGGEVGVYNREHTEKGTNEWAMFNCPSEEDWLKMEITLYHQDISGNWQRQFTRPYDYYWWCTGFKNGHLRQEEPADELRLTGRITLKDEEMTKLFTDGLVECGFKKAESVNELGVDEIYIDGETVHFCWQNISEAESTMAIKFIGGMLSSLAALPFFPIIWPFIAGFVLIVMVASLLV